MTYIYTHDGTKKIDIDKAKLLGDVNRELGIYRQGERTQLWKSASGNYFTGSCLDFTQGHGGKIDYSFICPMTVAAARAWVLEYYGPSELSRFGFNDDALEL